MMLVSDDQIVSVYDVRTGVQITQFLPSDTQRLVWSRGLREVSRCDLTAIDAPPLDVFMPWLHWVAVWDAAGTELYWTGPIVRLSAGRTALSVSARDVAEMMRVTRCPLGKSWEATDPATIARELWEAMVERHGLNTAGPVVRPDPKGERIDFTAKGDEELLIDTVDGLVRQGLRWSVVAGVPVFGPAPAQPVVALGEHDFLTELQVIRDGANVVNDLVLRTGKDLVRARTRAAGLQLEGIVDADTVSNAEAAARQYLRHRGRIRDAIAADGTNRLHPDAPLDVRSLVPSTRVTVEARGVLEVMELTSVEVAVESGATSVSVGLASVDDDPPELLKAGGYGVR